MAGGMHAGRSRRSLADRAADSGVRPDGITAPSHQPSPVPPEEHVGRPVAAYPATGESGEGRHCWVRNPPDYPGVWPGLLVEWRQRHGAWQGRVTYAVTGPDGPALIENWLPAARLEPR